MYHTATLPLAYINDKYFSILKKKKPISWLCNPILKFVVQQEGNALYNFSYKYQFLS